MKNDFNRLRLTITDRIYLKLLRLVCLVKGHMWDWDRVDAAKWRHERNICWRCDKVKECCRVCGSCDRLA